MPYFLKCEKHTLTLSQPVLVVCHNSANWVLITINSLDVCFKKVHSFPLSLVPYGYRVPPITP